MNGWSVLFSVLAILFLLGQIRLGCRVEYSGDSPTVRVHIGAWSIKVFPFPEKKGKKKAKTKNIKDPKRPKKSASPQTAPKPETVSPVQTASKQASGVLEQPVPTPMGDGKVNGTQQTEPQEVVEPVRKPIPTKWEKLERILEYVETLLPVVLDAITYFGQNLCMDTLKLDVVLGSRDPADVAMYYGKVTAALGAVWEPLTRVFHVKDGTARVVPDFEATEITVYAFLRLTLKLGQILWFALYFGIRGLWCFLRVRNRQKKQQQRKAV